LPEPTARVGPPEAYPNPMLTPGSTNPRVTQRNVKRTICASGYAAKAQPTVSYANRVLRRQIANYHYADADISHYELDHVIPIGLGGDPDAPSNIWPEPLDPAPAAHDKDGVETYLHDQVCSGQMTLDAAQQAIQNDWVAVYQQMPNHPDTGGANDSQPVLTSVAAAAAAAQPSIGPRAAVSSGGPSYVTYAKKPDGSFEYLVNGQPRVFIGMGYDAIYRYLPDEQRRANYRRDFKILQDAGVNTITGWDADKGYEQDKFDEITLDTAQEFGIGVIMPLNLPPEGDYEDPAYVADLIDQAKAKVARFKDHPALRMWGVGNEVFWEMDPEMYPAFQQAYLQIADVFHELDPDHPVIYRESEDRYVPRFMEMLEDSGDMRPWLLYGMNVYDQDIRPLLERWPEYELDRPTLVSEFGGEGDTSADRGLAYLDMWRGIREFSRYVLGGAPYVWSTDGPEPTDVIWGLMDGQARPVDATFELLSQAWREEPTANRRGSSA
jgi:hypothetical protein